MTLTDSEKSYDVVAETKAAFKDLVDDPRLAIPDGVKKYASDVVFEGSAMPWLCVPFKFAEAIASVKGLEAIFVAAIAAERYGVDTGPLTIDVDHATLFVFSGFTTTINGINALKMRELTDANIRDCDIADSYKNPYRQLCTNIYKTKDGRFYHLHGSLNARTSMRMIGLDPEDEQLVGTKDRETLLPLYTAAVAKWDAEDLDKAANDVNKQAGTICYSHEEFKQLEAGKAIVNCPIYELHSQPGAPVAWPVAPASASPKALSGIKVLELTRIIAAPAIGRGLAEHGATVLRITTNTLPDLHSLHPDLNQGKYVADLNLKTEDGRRALRELAKDADVFIDGYRPGALARLGFSPSDLRALNPNIIVVRENCYGWHGPWAGRSGWQQISDCFTGTSEGFGRALGLPDGEAVVPIFPNSDYGAGESGLVGVLHALYLRATRGGAIDVDVSLSYYNLHVLKLGTYPAAVWDKIRPEAPIRHDWEMTTSLPAIIPELARRRPDVFANPKFWHELDAPSFGGTLRTLRNVVRPAAGIRVGIERGAVQNGDDPAEWPQV